MKNILLILSLALTVSACSKETPDVDTTEQQHLIVGHWQHYRLIDNNGNMGESVDTSRISDVAHRGFLYYSSDGKKYRYEIWHNIYCIMDDTVDYIITSKGNDILEREIYADHSSYEVKITLLTETNLNIQYKYYTACYVRADWAAEVYERGLLPQ